MGEPLQLSSASYLLRRRSSGLTGTGPSQQRHALLHLGQAVSRLSGGKPPGGVHAGPNSSARVNPAVRSRRRARLTGAEDSGVTPICSWSQAMILRVFVAATITVREMICAANRRQGRVGRLVRIARGLLVAIAVWHDLVHGLVEPGERRGTC